MNKTPELDYNFRACSEQIAQVCQLLREAGHSPGHITGALINTLAANCENPAEAFQALADNMKPVRSYREAMH